MIQNCNKCKQDKENTEFYFSSRNKNKLDTMCKKCRLDENKNYRKTNQEKFAEMRKKYYQNNLEKMRQQKRKYVAKTKSQKRMYDIEYRDKNKKEIAKYKKEWEKKQRKNPDYILKRRLRWRFKSVFKGSANKPKTKEIMAILGCSIEEFKSYIEKQFVDGMNWENYGKWHIDHIKPCYEFNMQLKEDVYSCFHYSNLRPLWAKDNVSRKRPNYYEHLQKRKTQSPTVQ